MYRPQTPIRGRRINRPVAVDIEEALCEQPAELLALRLVCVGVRFVVIGRRQVLVQPLLEIRRSIWCFAESDRSSKSHDPQNVWPGLLQPLVFSGITVLVALANGFELPGERRGHRLFIESVSGIGEPTEGWGLF